MWYTSKNEACAAASSSQQVWNAAQEKSESGRVDFLELEQAKQRVEELRTIIEKIIVFIMIRMRRNWKILSMMP